MRGYRSSTIRLEMAFDELREIIKRECEQRLWKAGNMLRTEIVKSFSEQKHGRPYKVGKTGKIHIASAPGEAPGIMYGGLKASIKNEVRFEDGRVVAIIGVPERAKDNITRELVWKYATWLEYGTRLMKPRPFLKPAYWKLRNKIKKLLEKKIRWEQSRLF